MTEIQFAYKSKNLLTYDEALIYCQFFEHNGFRDWRMPTKQECLRKNLTGWYLGRYSAHLSSNRTWWVCPVRTLW
jgi:hypothetical protein